MSDIKNPAWDEEDDSLPGPVITENGDGTTTVVSYRIDAENGNKIKVTQRVRKIVVKETVEHAVAERKKWTKYGLERGKAPGPNFTTTNVGENISFKLGIKAQRQEEEEQEAKKAAEEALEAGAAGGKKVVQCRTCGGDHFTSRCPYKEALGGDAGAAGAAAAEADTAAGAGAAAGPGGSSYIAPHLRNRPAGSLGLTDPGRTPLVERDDHATLRVTNLSEDIVEEELRSIFARCGRVVRCHLVKDRDTGRNRGFAFVSYELRSQAETACRSLNGFALDNLIMNVEFAKK